MSDKQLTNRSIHLHGYDSERVVKMIDVAVKVEFHENYVLAPHRRHVEKLKRIQKDFQAVIDKYFYHSEIYLDGDDQT